MLACMFSCYHDYMDNSLPNQTSDDQNAQQPPVSQQPPPVAPAQPVGSVAKEHVPVSSQKIESFIEPNGAETQPEVSVELKEHGVEAVADSEKPKLTEHHKNIGLRPAKESVPAPTQVTSSSYIKLPMTEEEAQKIIKTTSIKDSKHWLAVLIEKVYKQLGFAQ